MPKTKVTIALEALVLQRLDAFVSAVGFRSRSQAVEVAIREKLERAAHTRLARECAKLDPAFEKALADERLNRDLAEWPKY